MKKKRYTEKQIIGAIKEPEAGAKVDDSCRKFGISNGTFYNWRSKGEPGTDHGFYVM